MNMATAFQGNTESASTKEQFPVNSARQLKSTASYKPIKFLFKFRILSAAQMSEWNCVNSLKANLLSS